MGVVRKTGHGVARSAIMAGFTLRLLQRSIFQVIPGILSRRGFSELVEQMFQCGVKALAVTSVVAIFMGMIVALDAGILLRKIGNADQVGSIVAAGMCREMGPMITAIILTAMVGSTIAAEIGTMRISEEIDALEVMSIDPVRYLVTPRVVAMTLMTFALTVLADVLGTVGGGVVAAGQLGVSFSTYLLVASRAVEGRAFLGFLPKDVYSGLVKAIVFGLLISTVACAQGLRAKGGPLGVGVAVRRTVVISIMLILIFGYLITAFFYMNG